MTKPGRLTEGEETLAARSLRFKVLAPEILTSWMKKKPVGSLPIDNAPVEVRRGNHVPVDLKDGIDWPNHIRSAFVRAGGAARLEESRIRVLREARENLKRTRQGLMQLRPHTAALDEGLSADGKADCFASLWLRSDIPGIDHILGSDQGRRAQEHFESLFGTGDHLSDLIQIVDKAISEAPAAGRIQNHPHIAFVQCLAHAWAEATGEVPPAEDRHRKDPHPFHTLITKTCPATFQVLINEFRAIGLLVETGRTRRAKLSEAIQIAEFAKQLSPKVVRQAITKGREALVAICS